MLGKIYVPYVKLLLMKLQPQSTKYMAVEKQNKHSASTVFFSKAPICRLSPFTTELFTCTLVFGKGAHVGVES